VDQTTPCVNGNFNTGGASPKSLQVTSLNGDLTFTIQGNGQATGSTNQTLKWSSNAGSYYGNGDIGPGTGTTTHTWTVTGGTNVHIAGANFKNGISTVSNPTFSLAAGTYTTSLPRTETISTVTSGAILCYRTDGTPAAATIPGTCDASNTTIASNSGSVTVPAFTSTTYSVIATESGWLNSSVESSGALVIRPTIATAYNGIAAGHSTGNISAINGISIGDVTTGNYAGENGYASGPSLTWGTMDGWMQGNSGQPNGATITTTMLANSWVGTAPSWVLSNTPPTGLYVDAGQGQLGASVTVGSTAYSGTTEYQSFGQMPGTVGDDWQVTFPVSPSILRMNGFITLDPPDSLPTAEWGYGLVIDSFGYYAAIQLWSAHAAIPTGGCSTTYFVTLETGSAVTRHPANCIDVTPGGRYAFSFEMNELTGYASLALYRPAYPFAQVGTTLTVQMSGSGGTVQRMQFGTGPQSTGIETHHIDNYMFDWSQHQGFPNKPH
jgi:hypothetical protein